MFDRRAEARVVAAEDAAVRVFSKLGSQHRGAVADRLGPRFRDVAARMLKSVSEADIDAGILAARETKDWSLLPLLAGVVGRGSREQTGRAAEALVECAASRAADGVIQAPAFERALSAVLDAATSQGLGPGSGVLTAALLLLTPGARAGAFGRSGEHWLGDASEAHRLALRRAMRTLPGPRGACRAFELIARPELRRAAAERISQADDPDEIHALLRCAHLGRRPIRRTACRSRIDRMASSRLASLDGHGLGRQAARGLPLWLETIGAREPDQVAALEPLLAHPDGVARLASVLLGSGELRLDQSHDPSERVAWSAMLRLSVPEQGRVCCLDAEARQSLGRSPHASVRHLARRLPTRGDASPVSLVSWREALARRPAEVVEHLGPPVSEGDPGAIALVCRLGLSDHMLGRLGELLGGGEPRSASQAARALGLARSPDAAALLASAAEHADPRVRANAIESAAARSRRWGGEPHPGNPDDPHHRPATTSIRADLLAGRTPAGAADRVHAMLSSDDPDRRAAGLWLTERSARELKPIAGHRWADLAARVADAARHAPSPRERQRATRCARRMLAVTTEA